MMISIKIDCSPLSSNAAWQGRRFKTDAYEQFEKDVSRLLPYSVKNTAEDGLVQITYRFHLKHHKTTDYDNLIKSLQDILVKNGLLKDDRFIYRAVIEKVPATTDHIEVFIEPYQLPESV
jgi:Holliday junction resolvase RusA-like endonuclease